MNLIGSFIAWLMPTVTAWAVQFFTKKIALAVSVIAAYGLLLAAFIVCIKSAITTVLSLAIMPTWIASGIGMFLPFNFVAVFSHILSAKSCRYAFDVAREKIKLLNNAS